MSTSVETPFERVRIVGTGLLGTSIGLALSERGVSVSLSDTSPSALALAVDYGAGRPEAPGDAVDLVIVATPPDVTAGIVSRELSDHPEALVIDVASVKGGLREQLLEQGFDLSHYIGTHPMAGRERGGPTAARVDLFTGRPWIVCAGPDNSRADVQRLVNLVVTLGASPTEMSAEEHDRAVAIISHLPQVVSSVMAKQLLDAAGNHLDLAGQGVRDVTRIAGSDPALWRQILDHNAHQVAPLLKSVASDLATLSRALEQLEEAGAKRVVADALEAGARGVLRLPGKHGMSDRFALLVVVIDDRPGQLAALLTDIGELGVNLEDMRLEHSPGAAVGFVEIWVVPEAVSRLSDDLVQRGWRIAGKLS